MQDSCKFPGELEAEAGCPDLGWNGELATCRQRLDAAQALSFQGATHPELLAKSKEESSQGGQEVLQTFQRI
jgi:hypothetical protein